MAMLIEIPIVKYYKDPREDNRQIGSNPIVCSKCDYDFKEDIIKLVDSAKLTKRVLQFKYCPNCGAKFTNLQLVTLEGLLKREDL